MKMTQARLRFLEEVQDDFESQLRKLAKDYAAVTNQTTFGYMDSYSISSEGVRVLFMHQGCDCEVTIPWEVIDGEDLTEAAKKANAEKEAREKVERDKREKYARLARQKQYEKLKEEFG